MVYGSYLQIPLKSSPSTSSNSNTSTLSSSDKVISFSNAKGLSVDREVFILPFISTGFTDLTPYPILVFLVLLDLLGANVPKTTKMTNKTPPH